jgi:hypothetical protein
VNRESSPHAGGEAREASARKRLGYSFSWRNCCQSDSSDGARAAEHAAVGGEIVCARISCSWNVLALSFRV